MVLATGNPGMATRLWDLRCPALPSPPPPPYPTPPPPTHPPADGMVLATGNQDMTTRLWDLRYPARSFALLRANIGAIR